MSGRLLSISLFILIMEPPGFLHQEASGDIFHTRHLPVCDGGCLRQKPAFLRVQLPIFLCHHRTSCKNIHTDRKKIPVHRIPVDKQNHRQHQIRAAGQRIQNIHSHIPFHLKRKRFRNRLTPHMDIVIKPALLNQFILILPLKSTNRPAGQVIHSLYTKHKIKIHRRILSIIPDKNIPRICRRIRHIPSTFPTPAHFHPA